MIPFDKNNNPIPGIYHGVTPTEYFSKQLAKATTPSGIKYTIPSKSLLSRFADNPAKWLQEPPFEPNANMIGGSLLDCLLLTPETFKQEYILIPEDAPRKPTAPQLKAVKKSPAAIKSINYWDAFEKNKGTRMPISQAQLAVARAGVKQMRNHPRIRQLLDGSHKQTVVIAQHGDYLVKGMFDLLPNKDSEWGDAIVDLKRTSGFAPRQFASIIRKFSYDIQAAAYLWMMDQLSGDNRHRWLFVLSDSEPPYSSGICELQAPDIEKGKEKFFAALNKYFECVESQHWPTPYPEDEDITLPLVYRDFSQQ